MFTITYKSTRHLKKHYDLLFLKDYYGDDLVAMKEVLKLYMQETPKELQYIETCLERRDAAGAKAATHKIKTNVALLGITDPANFITAMHLHAADIPVQEEIVTLFRLFKSEVIKGLADIENDFFSQK